MAIRCKHCGKKYGNRLTFCPHCTGLQNIEVRFEGNQATGRKKFLMDMLDDVRQRLPDEDAFKTSGQIFFSTPDEIIKRWGTDSSDLQYIEAMKQLDEKLKLAAKECGHDPVCFVKILFEDGFPDGISVPDLKSEFLIPTIINKLIQNKQEEVRVLRSDTSWFGVTYKEDKPYAISKIHELINSGIYPSRLFE